MGEAEVEYLRLFEADKITEESLFQRAKSRVGPVTTTAIKCLSLPPGEFEQNQTPIREPSEDNDSNGSSDGIDDLKVR